MRKILFSAVLALMWFGALGAAAAQANATKAEEVLHTWYQLGPGTRVAYANLFAAGGQPFICLSWRHRI